MEDLPIAGALVWVEYTPLNCYWPCVVEKYNEDKVKIGSIPLSLKEYDWVHTKTMRYPFLAYIDDYASKRPPALMSLHGKFSPAVEEALQLELKRLGCPSPRIEYATRARSFDQRLLSLKAMVKSFAPPEDRVKCKSCERLGDLFSSASAPETEPKPKASIKRKATSGADSGKSSSARSKDVIKSSGSTVSSNNSKSSNSSSQIKSKSSSSSSSSTATFKNSSSRSDVNGNSDGKTSTSNKNSSNSSSSTSSSIRDWVPSKNETVFFMGCDASKISAGNAIVKQITYSREGPSPIKLELFFVGRNFTATYPLNLVRPYSLDEDARSLEQPTISPPPSRQMDSSAAVAMPRENAISSRTTNSSTSSSSPLNSSSSPSGKSGNPGGRPSESLVSPVTNMKARANPATAAPFPKTRIPLGVGCHVLTAGAFGSSEELARVISISEVDLDSDDSDGDSDISSAKRSSGGDLSKKKLYELLFSKDGATLSKEWTLSQFEKAAAAAQAHKVRQDQHRNMVSALSAKDGLPAGLAVGSLIPKKAVRGPSSTTSSVTKATTTATAKTPQISVTPSTAAAASNTIPPTAAIKPIAASTKKATPQTAASKSTPPTARTPLTAATKSSLSATAKILPSTAVTNSASAATVQSTSARPLGNLAAVSPATPIAAGTAVAVAASAIDISGAPWQIQAVTSLRKDQQAEGRETQLKVQEQPDSRLLTAAVTTKSRVPSSLRDPRVKKSTSSRALKTTSAPAPFPAPHEVAATAEFSSAKHRHIAATSPPAAAISALASLAAAAASSVATQPATATPPHAGLAATTDSTTDVRTSTMPSAVVARKISNSPTASTDSTDTWVAAENESPLPATTVSLGSDDDVDEKGCDSKTHKQINDHERREQNMNGSFASSAAKRKRPSTEDEFERHRKSSNQGHNHRSRNVPREATLEVHWSCSRCSCHSSELRQYCSRCRETRLTESRVSVGEHSRNFENDSKGYTENRTSSYRNDLPRGASLSSLFLASEKAAAMVAASSASSFSNDFGSSNENKSNRTTWNTWGIRYDERIQGAASVDTPVSRFTTSSSSECPLALRVENAAYAAEDVPGESKGATSTGDRLQALPSMSGSNLHPPPFPLPNSRHDNQRCSGTPDGFPPSQDDPFPELNSAAISETSFRAMPSSRGDFFTAEDATPGIFLSASTTQKFEGEHYWSSSLHRNRSLSRDSRQEERSRSREPRRGPSRSRDSRQERSRSRDSRRDQRHFGRSYRERSPLDETSQDRSRSSTSHHDRSRSDGVHREVHGTDQKIPGKVRGAQELPVRRANLTQEERRHLSSSAVARPARAPMRNEYLTKQPAVSGVPCRNWKAIGRCDMGDRCRFAHITDGGFKGLKKEEKMGPKFNRLCKFWNTRDGCFKGDRCEFIHHGSDLHEARESEKMKEVTSFHEAMDSLERARSSGTAT